LANLRHLALWRQAGDLKGLGAEREPQNTHRTERFEERMNDCFSEFFSDFHAYPF
jgi:hypothetical protein